MAAGWFEMQEEKKVTLTTQDLIYSQVQDLGKRMDRLENRMDKLEAKLEKFNEKLDNLNEKISINQKEVYAKFEKQDEKIEKLADKIDALRRDLTGGNQHNQILTATVSASLVALVISLLLK